MFFMHRVAFCVCIYIYIYIILTYQKKKILLSLLRQIYPIQYTQSGISTILAASMVISPFVVLDRMSTD